MLILRQRGSYCKYLDSEIVTVTINNVQLLTVTRYCIKPDVNAVQKCKCAIQRDDCLNVRSREQKPISKEPHFESSTSERSFFDHRLCR